MCLASINFTNLAKFKALFIGAHTSGKLTYPLSLSNCGPTAWYRILQGNHPPLVVRISPN